MGFTTSLPHPLPHPLRHDPTSPGAWTSRHLTLLDAPRLSLHHFSCSNRVVAPVERALLKVHGGMDPRDVDQVLLVGGSSRIPKVQQILQDLFPGILSRSPSLPPLPFSSPDPPVSLSLSVSHARASHAALESKLRYSYHVSLAG